MYWKKCPCQRHSDLFCFISSPSFIIIKHLIETLYLLLILSILFLCWRVARSFRHSLTVGKLQNFPTNCEFKRPSFAYTMVWVVVWRNSTFVFVTSDQANWSNASACMIDSNNTPTNNFICSPTSLSVSLDLSCFYNLALIPSTL